MNVRDLNQEIRELGIRGASFRLRWEIRTRLAAKSGRRPILPARARQAMHLIEPGWPRHLPFANPIDVAEALRERIPSESLTSLRDAAREAMRGRIICFSRSATDFGQPIDWNLQPWSGDRWDGDVPGLRTLSGPRDRGDIKLTWEVARFPHAYSIARAAAFFPEEAERAGESLLSQIEHFVSQNPYGMGPHWASGQEVALRLLALLFALDTLFSRLPLRDRASSVIAEAMLAGAAYIERHLDYARLAVYNNHLISEALALYGVGTLLTNASQASRWRQVGREILIQESDRQFYDDGAYIQQSHNYHRVAVQDLMWACAFSRCLGDAPAPAWLKAIGRSIDFLVAQQNPEDGRLPNYGANDGGLPSILSTCDYSDFRSTLQAASVVARGERLYSAGPWDEEAAWFLGPEALDAPLRVPLRKSVSFAKTGYHVLRGADPASFCTFRCGTLRDRFSQVDMLHLDVWWRGLNVMVDGGSYLYSGPEAWHNHFTRTGVHNTIQVDDLDQMVHFRQFKLLYWTKAKLLRFEDYKQWACAEGEHYGYLRYDGACVHRRSVLFVKDDLWIVVDHVTGEGSHSCRLHWLGGPYPWSYELPSGVLRLTTSAGLFEVAVMDHLGRPLPGDVVAGGENPPRGWLSRYYAEKVPAPSLAVTQVGRVPLTFVSVLSGASHAVRVDDGHWTIRTAACEASFALRAGQFENISVLQN